MNAIINSEIVADEFFTATATPGLTRPGLVKIPVNPQLQFRNVYLWIEAITAAPGADFQWIGEVEFRRNGQSVQRLPASIMTNTANTYAKTLLSSFCNVVGATQNALLVSFGQTAIVGTTLSTNLTPQRLRLECDEILFNSLSAAAAGGGNFSSLRAFLACRSSSEQT